MPIGVCMKTSVKAKQADVYLNLEHNLHGNRNSVVKLAFLGIPTVLLCSFQNVPSANSARVYFSLDTILPLVPFLFYF